jgi:DNA mismatch endonuclease (patch repair protein)
MLKRRINNAIIIIFMDNNAFKKAGYETTKERSRIMATIRSSNTKPEFILRKLLYHNGYRYRLHYKKLSGSPDIALTKQKIAIFVNGCFWHYHGCHISHVPKSNVAFWQAKIKRNLERDKKAADALFAIGWRVLIIWECALMTNSKLTEDNLLLKIQEFINISKRGGAIVGDK